MPSINVNPRIRNRIGATLIENKPSKNVRRIVIVKCVTLIRLYGVYNFYSVGIPPIFIVSVTWRRQFWWHDDAPFTVRFFPWTMRLRTTHPLRDRLGLVRLELAEHIWCGPWVGWGEQSLVRTQVSAKSCYDYPPPVCSPESGHVGQGRIVQGTLRPKGRIGQGRVVRGKTYGDGTYGDASLLHRNLYNSK